MSKGSTRSAGAPDGDARRSDGGSTPLGPARASWLVTATSTKRSREELLHELLVVPRWSGTQVIERPGWLQLITPTFRQGGLNEVVFSQVDPRDADEVIDTTIARYRELLQRFGFRTLVDFSAHRGR